MSVQEFDKIFYTADPGVAPTEGRLRFAQQGLGWKSSNGNLVTAKADDLKRFYWLRSARHYQLRVVLKDGTTLKFDNFDRDLHERVRDAVRITYSMSLDALETSVRGWNWGTAEVEPHQLVFRSTGRMLFELPFSEIANVNSSKNEVAIEFAAGDLPRNAQVDQLVECRMHVPGLAPSENDDGVDVEGDESADGANNQTAADYLCDVIKSKADLGVEKSDTIVSFKELPFLTPRGRYDVEMFKDFLRLRGKSYDYKIKYTSITKLFMLPKPDDMHVVFVIGLDPPLRQGQTRYPFLVLQFVRDDELVTEVNMDEQTLQREYPDVLQKHYDAPTYEVVSAIFRGLTGRKVTIPGQFRSSSGAYGIKCSLKANEGYLYPLEKSLLFIPKPATYMAYSDIAHVTFSRVSGGSSRTIDVVFTLRGNTDVPLSNIPREEYTLLGEHLRARGIKVKNELVEDAARLPYLDDDEDEDDEVAADAGTSSRRRAARGRGAAGTMVDDQDDEDEESPDEDFVGESESDPEEEFDSDYASDGGSDADDGEGIVTKSSKSAPPKRAAPGGDKAGPARKKSRKNDGGGESD
ncbi:FACT complex subunit [Blastocladiella emersonii ATCC 22665]|nr:FACT complex subunit [Blastocladiella emersonii ATCC 22665]